MVYCFLLSNQGLYRVILFSIIQDVKSIYHRLSYPLRHMFYIKQDCIFYLALSSCQPKVSCWTAWSRSWRVDLEDLSELLLFWQIHMLKALFKRVLETQVNKFYNFWKNLNHVLKKVLLHKSSYISNLKWINYLQYVSDLHSLYIS